MKNKVYSLANQVLASGFSFLTIIVSSRLLTPDEFGVISLLIMIVLLLSVFPQSFITMPIMSNSFKEKDINRYFFHNSIFLSIFLLFSFVLFNIMYVNNYLNIQKYFSLWTIVFYFFTFQYYEFIKRVMFVKNLHNKVTFYEIIKFFISFFTLMIFLNIYQVINIDKIIISISLGYLFFSMLLFKYISVPNFSIRYLNILKIKNYSFGKWIFISNIIQNINSNFYMYVAAALLPLHIIGALNAVRSLIGFSTVVFLALDNYLIPKYAKLYLHSNEKVIYKNIIKTYSTISILLIIIYILIALFSKEILSLIYGKIYAQYGYYLYAFLVANIFMFFTRPILILAKTIGITKVLFLSSLPTLFFTSLSAYSVIDIFKINGALFVMCFTQFIYLISLVYFYKRRD